MAVQNASRQVSSVYALRGCGSASHCRARFRFASPEQIGEFIAVLLSNKQGGMGFMTGSDVVVDGGK